MLSLHLVKFNLVVALRLGNKLMIILIKARRKDLRGYSS
jgi:hypothetical protein